MQRQNGLIQRTLHINGVKVRVIMDKKWRIPSRFNTVLRATRISRIAKEAIHF